MRETPFVCSVGGANGNRPTAPIQARRGVGDPARRGINPSNRRPNAVLNPRGGRPGGSSTGKFSRGYTTPPSGGLVPAYSGSLCSFDRSRVSDPPRWNPGAAGTAQGSAVVAAELRERCGRRYRRPFTHPRNLAVLSGTGPIFVLILLGSKTELAPETLYSKFKRIQ